MSTMIANPMTEMYIGNYQKNRYDLPLKPRKGKCRFHDTVSIQEIPTLSTYSAFEKQSCWYTKQDYHCFKLARFVDHFAKKMCKLGGDPKTKSKRRTRTTRNPKRANAEMTKNDGIPAMSHQAASPDPDQTLKSLPKNLPSSENSDFTMDGIIPADQLRKYKKMRAKLRRLEQRRQMQLQEEQDRSRSPTRDSVQQNNYQHRPTILLAPPTQRNKNPHRKPQYRLHYSKGSEQQKMFAPLPFPKLSKFEDRYPVLSMLEKKYQFEQQQQHQRFSHQRPYYPTESLVAATAAVVAAKSNNSFINNNTVNIVNSALSIFQEPGCDGTRSRYNHGSNPWPNYYA